MNCEQAKLVLAEYLLEETSGKDREEIGRHLQDCNACSEELLRLKQTMTLLVRGEAPEEIHRASDCIGCDEDSDIGGGAGLKVHVVVAHAAAPDSTEAVHSLQRGCGYSWTERQQYVIC